MIEIDVCIVGVGLGGVVVVLKFSYLGIFCLILDKVIFLCDKVCGDVVSGKVIILLGCFDLVMLNCFCCQVSNIDVWGICFVFFNGWEF